MEQVVICNLESQDVRSVVKIAVAAWAPIYEYRRMILGDALFLTLSSDWRKAKANQVKKTCLEYPNNVRVAKIEDRIVGFITFHIDQTKRIGEIGNNAVHPDFQGKGIGTKLYRYVLDIFRKQGMQFARVFTGGDPAHAPARKAYEKVGFSIQLPHVEYFQDLSVEAKKILIYKEKT